MVFDKAKWLRKNWDRKKFKRNLKFLLSDDIDDLIYRIKDETIEDMLIEADASSRLLPMLDVLSGPETLDMLSNSPKCFARFGDGEISIMEGKSIAFQRYEPELAAEMRRILAEKNDDLYVGLNSAYWRSPLEYGERNHRFYRLNASHYRRYFYQICCRDATYLDAACFCAYLTRGELFDFAGHYRRVRSLFEGKRLIILAGVNVLEKLQYDVFDTAAERVIIHGPSRDAFSERDNLVEKVASVSDSESIVCMVLGPTAKVLASDFAARGYVAWDIGHLAKDYDAWMRNMPKTVENMDAFWAPD